MTTAMAEGEGITAMDEGSARGEFRGGIIHNFIVTLFTPKCNLCNLDYNLGAKPLNSLNLNVTSVIIGGSRLFAVSHGYGGILIPLKWRGSMLRS